MDPAYHRDFFNRLRELTIRTVESMPEDKIDFKPENSRSFAEIVLHVVEAQQFILNMVTGRDVKPARALTVENYPTRAALVELLRQERQRALEILDGLSAEFLAEIVPQPFGPDGPRYLGLNILLFHEVDHKGNLVIMAKCCGADPPDIRRLREEEATTA